ncbi:MAG: hypothetical protein LKI39_07815 [Bacteroides sp.]|jgi:DNA repair exonuclease SbcCD ATPase subunit|nr:hypothetical protein [Bacteroides sp.]MCI1682448.1 hypothetical protein [Bacteroides sp.]
MNVDQGAMDFEAVMNNDKFIKAIDEAEKRVKGFSSSTVAEGEKIDDAFKITAENIKIQKDVIAGLESQLNNLNIEISKLSPGKAQAELKQQAAEVSAELKAEKDALKVLESQVETTKTAHVSLRTQLRMMREELIQMEAAGLRGTDAYQELQRKTGELKDAMGDAQQQIAAMANDERGFQGVVSALSGVAGAFSAAQGAVGLFAGENENLNKIMMKVQSLMAMTIGLQQVAETLNKDSYFNVVLLTKAKLMYAAAVDRVSVSLGISTVAAQALMATLTLGLSVAITAIIAGISAFASRSQEAKKATEEFNKSVVDLAGKPVATIQELSVAWSQLGDNIKAKEKFIEDNSEKFKSLGVSVKSVKDAEGLLSDPKHVQAFINAQILKAKAMATAELAAEKYKEAIKKQLELEKTPAKLKKTRTITDPELGTALYSYDYEVDNKDYSKLKSEKDKLEKEGLDLFKKAAEFSVQEKKILNEIGVSANNITKGSITALENSISKLKEKYKDAATDKERANLLKQIKAQEKVLDKMDQSDSSSSNKDTFKDKLDKRKKLYQDYFKWINSNDPILKKAADTEFAGMLKQGKSFLEYLKNQRDKLLSVSDQTATQKAQLKTINDMIAEETKKTVLQDFETALQKQMNSATSVLQMLDIISKKRKELSGDGSDLDTGKKEILDKADQSAQEQAQEETNKLIEDYASYLTRKLQLQQKYTDDMILLEKRLKEAQDANNPEDVAKIQGAISNRKEQYAKDSKLSGDSDYDAMVVQYRNFEQKKQAIIDEFDEKRKKAQEHGNTQLVEELNKAQAKALSSLASDELMKSADWNKLFGDLDSVATSEIEKLIALIEKNEVSLGVKLSPEDLKAVKDKLQEAKKEVETRNPFKALVNGIKEYSSATDDESKKKSFKKMFEGASSSIDLVKGAFDSVVGGLDKMGVSMDDQTKAVLNDISGIAQGASTLAQGIATGNPLAIIQGSIDIISNGIDLIWGSKDRKLEKQINQHKEAVEALTDAYSDLERAVDKALGGDTYKNQKQMIANLQQQRANYLEMIRLEEDKKKTDKDKIKEYENAYKEAGQTIEDVLEEISQDILQTNAKDFADQLGDAIVEAFGKGEDAATAFGDTVNDIMKNAILNQLKKNFLEKQLAPILKQLEDDMGYWNGDNFVFDGLTEEEQARFKAQIAALGQNFNSALGTYGDLFKDLADEVDDSSLTGGIKGVSEETASVLSGQINAMRINQAESLTVLRNQLMVLNQIAANTSYNKNLVDIRNDIRDIKNNNNNLRSDGFE